ncbi:hypothetical protein ACWCYY_16170 [Kitasatospora sp. NPDC001664]
MDHRTVKALADATNPDDLFRGQWQNRPSVLDDFKPYLDDRLLERLADVPTPAGHGPRELSLPPGAVALPIVETDAPARGSTRRPCCPPEPLG